MDVWDFEGEKSVTRDWLLKGENPLTRECTAAIRTLVAHMKRYVVHLPQSSRFTPQGIACKARGHRKRRFHVRFHPPEQLFTYSESNTFQEIISIRLNNFPHHFSFSLPTLFSFLEKEF